MKDSKTDGFIFARQDDTIWEYLLLSTGWKEVSLRLSNPVANSIWGTEQEPKLPMAPAAAVEVAVLADAALVAARVAAAPAVTVTVT